MRSSVILCDLLILFPAVAYFAMAVISKKKQHKKTQSVALFFLTICLPCLLLIDHGHFQYNGVSIGLALLGATEILHQRYLLGSVYFSLALNFKQMLLYYAPVFFFALLRKCYESGLGSSSSSFRFTSAMWQLFLIGSTVILTFATLWLPFCLSLSPDHTCPQTLLEILTRLFPFSRGIFEDKVSNIWYTLSVPFDFRTMTDTSSLVRYSLLLTLIFLIPVAMALLRRPLTSLLMAQSLVLSSLAFFLASFQVHEKSLLLSLVPAAFLLPCSPVDMMWFQISGTMTLFPLLIKDGQRIPYWCTLTAYLSFVLFAYHRDRGIFSPPQDDLHSTLAPYPAWIRSGVTLTRWLYYGISITGQRLLPHPLPHSL
jgi:alpha-1,3-glucosyltransferase